MNNSIFRCFFSLSLTLLLSLAISCDSDDNTSSEVEAQVSGEILLTFAGQPVTNTFASYFPDGIPSGAVNNTSGTSYENFFVRDKYKEFLYSSKFDQSEEGFVKVAIDADGVAQEIGSIASNGLAAPVLVVNDELGYFHDRNSVD